MKSPLLFVFSLVSLLVAPVSGGFLDSMTDWKTIGSTSFPDTCWTLDPVVEMLILLPRDKLDPTTDVMAFKYDSATQQIKIMDGRCLWANSIMPGFMILVLEACGDAPEFKFFEDADGKVHSAASGGGLCMDDTESSVGHAFHGVTDTHFVGFQQCDTVQGHTFSSAPAPPLVKARAEAIENGKPDPQANAVIATASPATKAPTDSPTRPTPAPKPAATINEVGADAQSENTARDIVDQITPDASPNKRANTKPNTKPHRKPGHHAHRKPTSTKKGPVGSASGDPHFKTFGGKKFDFHGGCDLVLLQNPGFANGLGLSVHIRTRIETWWSYIEAVVVQIGGQLLELMGGSDGEGPYYWVNGVAGEENVEEDQNLNALQSELGAILKGFKVIYKKVSSKQHKFRINLNHAGDAISLETYKDWISVNVKADKAENFKGSKGLMGMYPSGTMLSRSGKEIMDPAAFGKEWQVLDTEPMLFHEPKGVQHPEECAMPSLDASAGRKKRRLGEAAIAEEAAALACSHAEEEAKDGCIYDVLATNDVEMAGAY